MTGESASSTAVRSRPPIQFWPPSLLPVTLAAFNVLRLYIDTGVHPFAALRALIVAVAVALAVWLLVSAILRDQGKATVVAVLVVLGFSSWRSIPAVAVAAGLILVVALLAPRVLRVAFPWRLVVPAGNALSLVLALALAISALQRGTVAQLGRDIGGVPNDVASVPQPVTQPPDIYMVILEDRPRGDSLARLFGVDTGEFEDGLEELGLQVSARSRSNYSSTILSLLTMFHMRHIDAIPELEDLRADKGDMEPLLRNLLNDAPALSILRSAGYEIVAVPSGFEDVPLRDADRFLDGGEINEFEITLASLSALGPASEAVHSDFYGDQQRSRVHSAFRYLSALAGERADHPRFVFVHVFAPHGPILFGPHGEPVHASLLDPYHRSLDESWDLFRSRYADEIRYLDVITLGAMRDLTEQAEAPYVVVLMSEEGSKLFAEPDPEAAAEAVSTFFAASVPEGDAPFGAAITPVNIFPIVFNRYLGTAIPMQPDLNFVSEPDRPFDLREIPNTDAEPTP
jgi:hypothetical protein